MDMNSKTKIIVLHRRELLIGAIAAVIAILLLIFMISSLAGGSKMPQPALSTVPNLFLRVFPPAIHRVFTEPVFL